MIVSNHELEVYEAYRKLLRAVGCDYDFDVTKDIKTWRFIVDLANTHACDPARFLTLALKSVQMKHWHKFVPHKLPKMKETLVANFYKLRIHATKFSRIEHYESYQDTVRAALEKNCDPLGVYIDHIHDFPAWFRCLEPKDGVYASMFELKDIIGFYGEEAINELESDQTLRHSVTSIYGGEYVNNRLY